MNRERALRAARITSASTSLANSCDARGSRLRAEHPGRRIAPGHAGLPCFFRRQCRVRHVARAQGPDAQDARRRNSRLQQRPRGARCRPSRSTPASSICRHPAFATASPNSFASIPDLRKIVIITEKVSVHDAREVRAMAQAAGVDVFGGNCLGMADSWNRVRIGGALGGDNPREVAAQGFDCDLLQFGRLHDDDRAISRDSRVGHDDPDLVRQGRLHPLFRQGFCRSGSRLTNVHGRQCFMWNPADITSATWSSTNPSSPASLAVGNPS